jgi:hypothetical protein
MIKAITDRTLPNLVLRNQNLGSLSYRLNRIQEIYYFYGMGLYDFMILSKEEQWNELWAKGKFITNLKLIDRKYSLYALHEFFVEVELKGTTDKILGMKTFIEGDLLEKYSGDIDINLL